jgi:hypothetical protein
VPAAGPESGRSPSRPDVYRPSHPAPLTQRDQDQHGAQGELDGRGRRRWRGLLGDGLLCGTDRVPEQDARDDLKDAHDDEPDAEQ